MIMSSFLHPSPLSILFMGTPDLAAVCLEKLVLGGGQSETCPWRVVGVISQPDKPKGRNLHLQPTPVKSVALRLGIECFQPQRAREPESLEWIRSKKPDLIVVAAYGQILPQALLDIPRLGCINVHTSLLPRYRGAAPIQWAIWDDQPETGVSLMKMNAGLDTGDILAMRRIPISKNDNAATLHDSLAELGAELLVETLPDYASGKIVPQPQPQEGSVYARKIKKEDGHLDWTLSARELSCRVRALAPWPGCFTFFHEGEKRVLLKIWNLEPTGEKTGAAPGTILRAEADCLEVACGGETARIHSLQREGKKQLPVRDFLAGNRLLPGEVLE